MRKISFNLSENDYKLLKELNEYHTKWFEPLKVNISDTIKMAIWEAHNIMSNKMDNSK